MQTHKKITVNIWDFGGQDIYKSTHRFFLSHRSLYIILADSHKEDTDFIYWLNTAEMFGGKSPVLIVLNEKEGLKRTISWKTLQGRYGDILKEKYDVDFKTLTGYQNLKTDLQHYIQKLPHIGNPVPATWKIIREKLAQLNKDGKNYISTEKFFEICTNNKLTKDAQILSLSQFFHDIGVLLHFQNDDILERRIFLNKDWTLNAIYKIIDDKLIQRQKGRFTRSDAAKVWHEPEYRFIRPELLALMKRFYLIYEINNSQEYISPQMLSEAEPENYTWDTNNNLQIEINYDLFMPRGILWQFIVMAHNYISNHELVWRTGVVMEHNNAKAEIVETYGKNEITIKVSGDNRRDFMTIIANKFDEINSQYQSLKDEKLIPCNCDECKLSAEPYFFRNSSLKKRLLKGKQTIECDNSYVDVNVKSLIDDIFVSDIELEIKNNELLYKKDKVKQLETLYQLLKEYENKRILKDDPRELLSHKNEIERIQTEIKILENEIKAN